MKIRPPILILASLAAIAAAYAPALAGGFIWDDHALIENQDLVKHLAPLTHYFLRMFWSNPLDPQTRDYYRPLTTLSYALNERVGHGTPLPFHLTNLLLHLAACFLIYRVARLAGARAAPAALGMTLFGLAPRLTESVAWISGRTDILALLGGLGAVALQLRASRRERSRWPAAACLLAGLFSKETALAGLVVIVAVEILAARQRQVSPGRRILALWPQATALAIYAACRSAAAATVPRADSPAALDGLHGTTRLIAALESIGRYAFMIVNPFQPRTQAGILGVPSWPFVAVGTAALALLAALAALELVPRREAEGSAPRAPGAFGPFGRWGWALLAGAAAAIAPTLHLIPTSIRVLVADRFLYFPLALLAVWSALLLESLSRRRARALALCGLLLCLPLALATWLRASDWSDEPRFWKAELASSGESHALPAAELANAYLARSRPAEARALFARAAAIDRRTQAAGGLADEAPVTANLALSEELLGNFDRAAALYRQAITRYPQKSLYRYELSLALARSGRFDAARAGLTELAFRSRESESRPGLDPGAPRCRNLLGLLDSVQGGIDAARALGRTQPVAGWAAEARAWDELGAQATAGRLWSAVAAAPNASIAQIRDAAGFLALKGTADQARSAIARLRAGAAAPALADQLSATLADRFAE